jgi:long-chain fatty acid transport protein
LPDTTIRESWEDVYNYRLGIRWTASPTSQWRAGYVYDETPQREEGVSPLLPDADRNGFSLGYGYTGGIKADFAIMYLPFDERSRNQSFPGEGPFFGTYNTTAWLLGATLTF